MKIIRQIHNVIDTHAARYIFTAIMLTILMVISGVSVVHGADHGFYGARSPLLSAAGNDLAGDLASGSDRVFDQAGLFTQQEISSMEEEIAAMRNDMTMDVVVVTVDKTSGKSTRETAEDFYIDGEFGTGKEYDGVLLLIDMDNRELYIAPVGEMNAYLTDARQEKILDRVYDMAASGDYAAAAEAFLSGVRKYYAAGIPGGQYYAAEVKRSIRWYEALLALVVAAAAASGPCISVKNRYSMKKEVQQSRNCLMAYRADCKFRFADSSDNLINKSVTHIIIPRNNGGGRGGHGGGSSSGRSTVHTNSGRSFGGSGRKF